MRYSWLFPIVFLCGCFHLSVAQVADNTIPKMISGKMDLRHWDFATQGEIKLEGSWTFYWKRLLPPSKAGTVRSKDYMEFPAIWNDQSSLYAKLNGQGFATYTADILIHPSVQLLSLQLPDFYSSYRLWVNGKEVAGNGLVGTSRRNSEAQWLPHTVVFPASEILHLVLQVSNFQHHKGGCNDHIYLGAADQLFKKREEAVITNVILFGGLIFIGFFFVILYLFFRSEKAALYFAAICITWAVRSVFTNLYLFINWFPGFDWELGAKIEYLTLYLTMMWSVLFVAKLFPEDTNSKVKYAMLILNSVFILLTLATPAFTYSSLLKVYMVVAWIILSYVAYIVLMAILYNRKGAWFSALSIFMGVVMFSYDMLTHSEVIDSNPFLFNVGYITIFLLNATAFAYQLSQTIKSKPEEELEWSLK
jgi:7TM diverse intracellular signalling